ncbi:hypothetical protein JCM10049v2_004707 [Rhodotorula toruloides]
MSSEPVADQQDDITHVQDTMQEDERLERGEAETVTVPRKRAPSPFSLSRQDSQRPFAFKRNSSSGFSAFMNYAAAASTSEVRTRPATPAESATRSTFDDAIRALAMPVTTSGSTDDASASASTAMDVSSTSAPVLPSANGTNAGGRFDERPKGQGTLELERVLGLWAAKTPTNSFPNLPPLPNASSSSSAPSTSQPLFAQSVVTAEPESIDFATSSSQPEPGVTSTSFSSIFVDFANLASQQPTSASSRDSLALPRDLPRRQRSKSEADIMRFDTLGFGGPTALDFSSSATPFTPTSTGFNFSLDFGARFLPTFNQQAPTPPVQAPPSSLPPTAGSADMPWRPPSAPSAYPFPPTSSTAQTQPLVLQTDQRELQLRVRTPSGMQRGAGGPGYREAALLDVGMDRGRRARSQGAGHRRTAKSDDFTHLFSPTTAAFAQQQQQQQQATFETSNGHLAPPGEGQVPVSMPQQQPYPAQVPPQQQISPHAHHLSPQPHQPLQLPQQSPHQHHQHPSPQPQVVYLPNGTPLPVAYFGVDPAVAQAVSQASQQQHQPSPSQPQQQLQPPPGYPRGAQFSPQGNALALAAAQAAQAHAAQQIAAAAAAALQFANGGVGQQQQQPPPPPPPHQPARRSIAGEPSHSTEYTAAPHSHSHLPPPLPPPPGQPNFFGGPDAPQQRTPYMYHSTLAHATLPSPPMSARNGVKRARDEEGLGEGEDEDESEDDELVDDEEYEDDEEEYGRARGGQRAKGKAVAKGKAPASTSKPKTKKPSAPRKVANGSGGENGPDEFTKESKTTQATIDAAKRRRNANAVAKFVCELCGETFTRRYNLRGHQRAHKGEKPYKCSYEGCDKAFARAHDCKRHELLHLGVRKYHCSPCNRDFVRLDALHRHHRSEVGQACVQKLQSEGAQFDERGAIVAADL